MDQIKRKSSEDDDGVVKKIKNNSETKPLRRSERIKARNAKKMERKLQMKPKKYKDHRVVNNEKIYYENNIYYNCHNSFKEEEVRNFLSKEVSRKTPGPPGDILILKKLGNVSGVMKPVDYYEDYNEDEDKIDYSVIFYYKNTYSILGEIIKEKKGFSEKMAHTIFVQLLKIVQECMQNGIFYRDLHHKNIIIDQETNEVKVFDFTYSTYLNIIDNDVFSTGFPKNILFNEKTNEVVFFDLDHDQIAENATGYTDNVFSPGYTPIEWYLCGKYSAESALVWTLGTILYIMINNRYPYKKNGKPLYGLNFKKNLSREVIDLIWKCLAIHPKKRITLKEINEHPWIKWVLSSDKESGQS